MSNATENDANQEPKRSRARTSVDFIARQLPGERRANRKCIVAFLAWCSAELEQGRDVQLYNIGHLNLAWRKRAGRNGWCIKFAVSGQLRDRLKESLHNTSPQLKHLTGYARAMLNGKAPTWKRYESLPGSAETSQDGSGGVGGLQNQPGGPPEKVSGE